MSIFDRYLDISKVRKYLYLSGYKPLTRKKLRERGITHAVDATDCNLPGIYFDDIKYLRIPVRDLDDSDIEQFFESVVKFIDDARKDKGKVIVYCMAGISRSPTLVLAYLVRRENLTLRYAYFYLLSKRRIIDPNNGFWRQLIQYEWQNHYKTTVRMTCRLPDVYLNDDSKRRFEEEYPDDTDYIVFSEGYEPDFYDYFVDIFNRQINMA